MGGSRRAGFGGTGVCVGVLFMSLPVKRYAARYGLCGYDDRRAKREGARIQSNGDRKTNNLGKLWSGKMLVFFQK